MSSRYQACVERIRKIFPNATDEFIDRICNVTVVKVEISNETLESIKNHALQILPLTQNFRTEYTLPNGKKVDVVFVMIPSNPQIKVTKSGNYKIGLLYPGGELTPWISAFFEQKELAEKVAESPNGFALLIGKFKERTGTTSPYAMNVYSLIILDKGEAEQIEGGEVPVEGEEEQERGEEVMEEMNKYEEWNPEI